MRALSVEAFLGFAMVLTVLAVTSALPAVLMAFGQPVPSSMSTCSKFCLLAIGIFVLNPNAPIGLPTATIDAKRCQLSGCSYLLAGFAAHPLQQKMYQIQT